MRNHIFVSASFAALLTAPGFAHAQDDTSLVRSDLFVRDRNVSVRQRPKPEYANSPIPVGGFFFTPTLTTSIEGNDNIYATTNGAISDTIFRIQPSGILQSNWSRNALAVYGRASFNQYVDNGSESTTDYQFGTSGRLDVHRDLGFSAGGSYEHDTEPRTASGSPGAAREPVRYYLGSVYGQGTKQFNRLRVTGRVDFRDFNYENVLSTTGGQIYEDDRDHSIVSAAGKVEYAISPDKSVFFNIVGNDRQFRNQLPGEIARDSSGYEITVGSNFDVSHLIRGELYLGYLEQDYKSQGYGSIGGISARGRLEYFPTTLTTVSVTGSRSVEDAGILNVSGYLSSNVAVQLDHEFLRNLIANATFTYGKDEYQNLNRDDDRYSFAVGGTYLINRAVGLNVTYSHQTQDSHGSAAGPSFDINRIIGSLVFQF